MAITTKTTETFNGITYGLSDACDVLASGGNWTASELARFSWCRYTDKYINCLATTAIDVTQQQGAAVFNLLSYFNHDGGGYLTTKYVDDKIATAEPYAFNILMRGDGGDFVLNSSNAANYKVVTSCSDFQKLYVKVDEYQETDYTVQFPTARTIKRNRLTWVSDGVYNSDNDLYTDYITVWTVLVIDENTFFVTKGMAFPGCTPGLYDGIMGAAQNNIRPSNWISLSRYPENDKWYYPYGDITTYDGTKHFLRWYKNGLSIPDSVTWDDNDDKSACWDVDSEVSVFMCGYWGVYNYTYYLRTENAVKNAIAYTGLRWKYANGDTTHTYTPIIDGDGYITGWSTDPDAETKLNDIVDVTGNEITPMPPTPPGPSPGPYDDDPWHGATFAGTGVGGAGAFAKCYYMTSTELANLRSWMNSINVPEGFDPMQQIIGLSQVPVALSGSSTENVVFVNSSAVYDPGVTTRAVDTGVSTQQSMGTPISYYLGSVDIVRRMQQRGEPYLDYDCQIELYLPLIGMFSLDTQAVMGRTIYAYAVLDPVSGTLAAYAYVSKDGQNLPVAYGSTTIGVDLPISAQQLSISRASLKQANAQLGTSLLSSALSMIAISSSGGKGSGAGAKTSTGSSGLSAAGIREAGGDYMKASQVGNVFGDFMNWGRTIRQLSYGNNTAISGSFGGSSAQWSYPFTPYVKIIRPRYEKPDNYAHSQGVPYVHTKKVGECTGFIQCINADVSGITRATDLERQAIQAALNNGVFAGGGS